MAAAPNSVHGRIDRSRIDLTPSKVVIALVLIAAVGYTLLFLQEPLVHDSLHNFRHTLGVTCH